MGAWRNNMPTTFATSSAQVGSAYVSHWTGLVAAHIGDDRAGSLSKIIERARAGAVPDITLAASTANPVAQDDVLRFDGTNDQATAARDADSEGVTTAGSIAVAARLLATTSGAGHKYVYGLHNNNIDGPSFALITETNNTNVDVLLMFANSNSSFTGNSGYNNSWNGIASPTTTDVIIVARWASGEAPYLAIYRASDGTLLDSGSGSTATGTITYDTNAASGFRMGMNDIGTPTAWLNYDFGGGYIWSKKVSDQEIADLVIDFHGPVRVVAAPRVPKIMTQLLAG